MPEVTIRPPHGPEELERFAGLMAASAPWTTLGIGRESVLRSLAHPDKEILIADVAGAPVGLALLNMHGVLAGYLQSLFVAEGWRGRGVGGALLAAVEARVLRELPNVFLLVSSFNAGARRLYARAGYQEVGVLTDFVAPGHDEVIMRKSVAPIVGYAPRREA